MQEYKYTYQDWLEGKIVSEQVLDLFKAQELSDADMILIARDQERAYLRKIQVTLRVLKEMHIGICSSSFVYDDVLDHYIREVQEELHVVNESYENGFEYEDEDQTFTIEYDTFDRPEFDKLTRQDVEKYLNPNWEYEKGFTSSIFNEYNKKEDFTQFDYIVRSNLLNWLQWHKKQREVVGKEPVLNYTSRFDPIGSAKLSSDDYIKSKKDHSYTWLSKHDTEELPELYQRLINSKLIALATSLEQFEAVFTAKPIERIQVIEWIGGKALLAYFVDSIFSSGKIPISTNHWSVAEKCFTDGKELAKSKVSYEGNKKRRPKNYHLVDEALKGL